MNFKAIVIFLAAVFGGCAGCGLYLLRPYCDPSFAKRTAPTCEGLGNYSAVNTNGLYSNYGQFYNVLGSRYYFARLIAAFGEENNCPTDNETLYALKPVTPWSGLNGGSYGIAIDGTKAFNTLILRKCTFPTDTYPFLCTGKTGTCETLGACLGTLSYIPLLQDLNNRWTLFGHCWNAKRPLYPTAVVVAVSFNVFSLDSFLTDADYALVIQRLVQLGFSTNSDNLIRPDFPIF